MATQTTKSWARWEGTIHHPFRITNPGSLTILEPGSQSPSLLIEYRLGWAGWMKTSFNGRCEQGLLSGRIDQNIKRSFLRRDLGGELMLNGRPLGTLFSDTRIQASEVAGISSASGTFSVSLRRARPSPADSDLILETNEFGPVATIFAAPQAKFLGRITLGQFAEGMEGRIWPGELRAAAAGLLALHCSLIQPMRDVGSHVS